MYGEVEFRTSGLTASKKVSSFVRSTAAIESKLSLGNEWSHHGSFALPTCFRRWIPVRGCALEAPVLRTPISFVNVTLAHRIPS